MKIVPFPEPWQIVGAGDMLYTMRVSFDSSKEHGRYSNDPKY
jgi:hypothetical protein